MEVAGATEIVLYDLRCYVSPECFDAIIILLAISCLFVVLSKLRSTLGE